MNIPRCMSTQHPDNVNLPFFAENSELAGEDEIAEAYYAFSHLGCDEQMWDCEGKEVDNYVIKKLLTKYDTYFKGKVIGKDVFITLRVPNPSVEKAEAKILLETLESIPRSFDAAKIFYQTDVAPIFEVIIPMVTSHLVLDRVFRYYSDFVTGKQNKPFSEGDVTIAEWIGEFKPESINVIPLIEDMEHMLDAHNIVRAYLKNKRFEYQRVMLGRSDTALNYGLISAVLLIKNALKKLDTLSRETGIPIYPIVGVGSAPFRGNLTPKNVERVGEEYSGVYTITAQSAFKYDNPPEEVSGAVKRLKERKPGTPQDIDEEKCLDLLRRYHREYQNQIIKLAPIINFIAPHVPGRRKRKLHIGLFGYSRSMGEITLPRAITFTAALYSIGIPPEILGLNALDREDIAYLKKVYVHFDEDLRDSLRYFNPDSPFFPKELTDSVSRLMKDVELDKEHKNLTGQINNDLIQNKTSHIGDYLLRAAHIRKFLG